ncbi:MAG: restriction endonuclease [Verrucomicrobiota bacterium]
MPLLVLEAILCAYAFKDLILGLPPAVLPLILIAGATALTVLLFDEAHLSDSIAIPEYSKGRYHRAIGNTEFRIARKDIIRLLKNASEDKFERFCTYLLRAEGYTVEHAKCSSFAEEFELIATAPNGEHNLIQCNSADTKTKIDESDLWGIRGDMAHMEILKGAVYTVNGWTRNSIQYARTHKIELVDLQALVERAERAFSPQDFRQIITTGKSKPPIPIG